jgi:hypothetical protein
MKDFMKLLIVGLLIGSGAYGQDARLITLVQERDAQAQRLNARIEYELAHPYAPAATPSPAPQPAPLSAEEIKAIHEALDRMAACVTGKLVKQADSPLYVPEVSEACLSKASTATATAAKDSPSALPVIGVKRGK